MAVRMALRAHESLEYEGCACVMGWSIRSTHFPKPCGRLLTSEHIGQVGKDPLVDGLCILYVT